MFANLLISILKCDLSAFLHNRENRYLVRLKGLIRGNLYRYYPLLWICSWILLATLSAEAQVIPDNTLGRENSIVTPNAIVKDELADLIEGGAIRGNNIFHSFEQFNVSDSGRVYFANPDGIANILTRVTGNNLSQIFGTLGVNGNANLFLLNPNGIVFGQNAALDINGSFIATTANSYIFGEETTEFSATNPDTAPLLSINLTPGLQMGNSSGKITVLGNGHLLTGGSFFPLHNNNPEPGLQIKNGQTLSLIAGEIELDGGILKTVGGNIELLSIEKGNVTFDFNSHSEITNTSKAIAFGKLELRDRSLLDASGFVTGNIRLQGREIALKDASAAIIQNLGFEPSGNIAVKAIDSLTLSGSVRTAPETITPLEDIVGVAFSRLTTETLNAGKSGDIVISAKNLSLNESGAISARSYSSADTGNLNLEIAGKLQIEGASILNPLVPSLIATTIFDNGNSGTINIAAENIDIVDGGTISSLNFGSGKGGDIKIDVARELKLSGKNPIDGNPSSLSSTVYRTGNSSNVTINASRVLLFDGGRVNTTTLAEGDAGQLTINASDSIAVIGSTPDRRFHSTIASDGLIINDPLLRNLLGIPDIPSGNSGNLTLNTSNLIISDRGNITVSNQGLKNSGRLKVTSDRIMLNNNASITAFSASGQGGNIELQVKDWLSLNNYSAITAQTTANVTNNGSNINGGNIDIQADIITLLENSQINADATEGNGGNINLTTEGLFVSVNSSISASSQFGLDGNIEIETISSDRKIEIDSLPKNTLNATQKLTTGCGIDRDFIIAGKGGLPDNPTQKIGNIAVWQDLRLPVTKNNQLKIQPLAIANTTSQNRIAEATNWQINSQGNVELIAHNSIQSSSNWQNRCVQH